MSIHNLYKVPQYFNTQHNRDNFPEPIQPTSVLTFFQQQTDGFVYENSPVPNYSLTYPSHIFSVYPWVSRPKVSPPLYVLFELCTSNTSNLLFNRAALVNVQVLLTSSLSLRCFDFFLFSAPVHCCNYPVLWLTNACTHPFTSHNTARVPHIIYM